MNDAVLVRRVERIGNLARDREALGDRQRSTFQPIGKRRPVDQLENERRHAIGFLEAVDRANVGMIQRGEQARFARETRTALGICSVV